MILAILAVWFGYKKARDTGRNPFLWAAICGGTFIGLQLLVGLGFGVLIGIGIELWGWPENTYDDFSWLISLAAAAVSFVALYLLFRYLDKLPDDEAANELPPPPPTFDQTKSL